MGTPTENGAGRKEERESAMSRYFAERMQRSLEKAAERAKEESR